MEKNEIITLEITALTSEGFGVGKCNELAVFVPKTAVGDVISCRIVKVLKNYAYGKIERIITPSYDRIENTCKAYGKCGGCCYRHINYGAELRAKERIVRDAFERIGGFKNFTAIPICGSDNISEYRNKLQMPLDVQDGKIVSGFFHERTHDVIPVENCELQPLIFSRIVEFIKSKLKELKISVYSEQSHTGLVRHIYIRKGQKSGEICVTIVSRKNPPAFKTLAKMIADEFPDVVGVVLNLNPERTNVILGETEITLCGRSVIRDEFCGLTVEISPKSFYQVNSPQAERLYKQAREFIDFTQDKIILDLYCGTGTIGLSIANKQDVQIIGAEIVPQAVENALRNAKQNGIENAEFICADAGKAAQTLLDRGINPDVIVLDPPRKGCSQATLDAVTQMNPARIIMISCNPATAARDCKILSEHYKLEQVRAVDLFPRTKHVECVVLMSRTSCI